MKNLKGWRTLLFGLLLMVAPAALHYLAGINWADYLSPQWVPPVTGTIVILLRLVTTTTAGKAS